MARKKEASKAPCPQFDIGVTIKMPELVLPQLVLPQLDLPQLDWPIVRINGQADATAKVVKQR